MASNTEYEINAQRPTANSRQNERIYDKSQQSIDYFVAETFTYLF